MFVVIGVLVMITVSKTSISILYGLHWPIYILEVILLLLTLIIGQSSRGSTRWLFGIQTSEIAKPMLIIFLSQWLVGRQLNKSKNLFLLSILSIVPLLLIRSQPDLGSAIVVAMAIFSISVFAGIPKKWILGAASILIVFIPLLPKLLAPYQMERLESFVNPYHDPKGRGYNVIQSVIAIGSGGIIGRGVRLGTQSHLNFLPERHTDFIFASFVEEFGLLGATVSFLAYFALFSYLIDRLKFINSQRQKFTLIGIITVFFVQFTVNVGMNMGIMPVTGITLPFFSYGGSSIITNFILLGLAIQILELNPRLTL